MKNPKTPSQWQEAVDLAYGAMVFDSAKMYGLVTGPKVVTSRCEHILRQGKRRGVLPAADAVERFIRGMTPPLKKKAACPRCDGTGLQETTEGSGHSSSVPCICEEGKKMAEGHRGVRRG
jgi:hypothetical protein